ncbi:MAG: glycogen/starch/alpha-glucan phosphorylase [Deltaproteobacteria bacterium]|nr:glycogen/starch/alpha-glucan phosphorylase [Deltaproteobacteria bacterium]
MVSPAMTEPSLPTMRQVEDDRTSMTPEALSRAFLDHVKFTLGHTLDLSTALDRYAALALTIRDRLMDRWIATKLAYDRSDCKRVFYLSAEFLTGRALLCNLQALDLEDEMRSVLAELGISLDDLVDQEPEPGLGNGGLGRLAACFLESMATLSIPGQGYGIRYEFGIFEQEFKNGQQVERADEWLRFGNPWELPRPEHAVQVGFGGSTHNVPDGEGGFRVVWTPSSAVVGVPHDVPVAGFRNGTVNTLRLWAAKSSREFDFSLFNAGDYVDAVEGKNASEVISKVLYPNDSFEAGRELRLRQEYFFVACSIHDIVRKHLLAHGSLANLSDKAAIQLNDTHPAVAIAELMRVLIDEHTMSWDEAWKQTVAAFGYTNHTLMPEALERWPVHTFEKLLPRHLDIIREVDRRFAREVMTAYPHDRARVDRMAIIDHGEPRQIHMARLAVVGSHAINGVAALHTELLKTHVMRDFAELFPDRFSNKTNGVTPRRWLLACNPQLCRLVTDTLGHERWIEDTMLLRELEGHLDDENFLGRLAEVKLGHKKNLAGIIQRQLGVHVDASYLFDVQIKRLHEYKRQLLNLLHIVALYLRAKRGEPVVPRLYVFGAKAAPGYRQAKNIIRLINDVANVVNGDHRVPEVRIAFLPNYRVTLAERIIPAADLSEQISTAGKEASGTGNMKLGMNGALTIGTLDGANIEIRDAVGDENFFLFGMTVEEVTARLASDASGRSACASSEELRSVVDLLADGFFNPDEPHRYRALLGELLERDEYMVFGDFDAYSTCQRRVSERYLDRLGWIRMAARNVSRLGGFSSDRTIGEYASEIWGVHPVPVSAP